MAAQKSSNKWIWWVVAGVGLSIAIPVCLVVAFGAAGAIFYRGTQQRVTEERQLLDEAQRRQDHAREEAERARQEALQRVEAARLEEERVRQQQDSLQGPVGS